MMDDEYLKEANELLKEGRKKLLFEVDDDGEPKCTILELMNFWDRVNAHLEKTT